MQKSQPTVMSTYLALLMLGFKGELKNKEKMASPFILGAMILIMFSFATGELEKEIIPRLFTAELMLTILFSLSIYFIRVFETEHEDGVFNQLRSLPISRAAWFFSKFTLVSLLSSATAAVVLILASGFVGISSETLFPQIPQIVFLLFLTITGLASIGILLSAVTLTSKGRSIIFPLLYYPLTVPVLLAATQSINLCLTKGTGILNSQWGIILIAFDAIYLILSVLLFEEFVD